MNRPSIAAILYRHFQTTEEKRFIKSEGGWLNVTDLWDTCMRQIFLATSHGIPVVQRVEPAAYVRFRMGEVLEEIFIQKMQELDLIEKGHESLRDEDLKIIGHRDVRFKNGMIGEIKCQAPELFRICKVFPLKHHQFQLETYLTLDGKHPEGILVSFTYGQEKMPFRDQTIRFNVKNRDLLKNTVGPLREAQAGGPIPSRVCNSMEDSRAQQCPVQNICFQLPTREETKTIREVYESNIPGKVNK